MSICQSNTYRKHLSWQQFDDEQRVQERQQVKDQQSCIPIFLAYRKILSSNHKRKIQSSLRRKKLQRTNQGSNYLGGSFSSRYNVRVPIQFRKEIQSQHHKRWFFFKNIPIHFDTKSIIVSKPVKQTSWLFALKSTSYFLPQSTVSCRSDSSSEANSIRCLRSDSWSHLQ